MIKIVLGSNYSDGQDYKLNLSDDQFDLLMFLEKKNMLDCNLIVVDEEKFVSLNEVKDD